MNRGTTKRLALLATAVALVAIAGVTAQTTAASRQGAAAGTVKVGIVYSTHRACSPPTAPSTSRACKLGLRVRHQRHQQGQRPQDRAHVHTTTAATPPSRHDREGPDRPGLQDHRRRNIVGRRAAARADRRAEPGPVHLGPGGERRHHRRQQVHVPLRPPDVPGHPGRRVVPRQRRRARRSLVFAQDTRLRSRQLRRGQRRPRQPRPHGLEVSCR